MPDSTGPKLGIETTRVYDSPDWLATAGDFGPNRPSNFAGHVVCVERFTPGQVFVTCHQRAVTMAPVEQCLPRGGCALSGAAFARQLFSQGVGHAIWHFGHSAAMETNA